jgi:RNA polymerase sigma-70 factor, ECF subfamily
MPSAMPSSNRPDDEKFKAWLLRIALNEARMRRCKDRVQLYESLDDDSAEDEQDDLRPKQFADWRDLPSDALDREEFRKAVREALAKLPKSTRLFFCWPTHNLSAMRKSPRRSTSAWET